MNYDALARLGALRVFSMEEVEAPNLAPLSKLTSLREIELIGVSGVELDSLVGLSDLKLAEIVGERPRISPEDFERLRATLPGCTVRH